MGRSNRILRDLEQKICNAAANGLGEADLGLHQTGADKIEFVEGVKGIAEFLKVSESTVKRWIRHGKLPVWQPAGKRGKVYLSRKQIQRLACKEA